MLNLIIHNQSEDQKKAVDVIASENIRILEEAKQGRTAMQTVRDGLTQRSGQAKRI